MQRLFFYILIVSILTIINPFLESGQHYTNFLSNEYETITNILIPIENSPPNPPFIKGPSSGKIHQRYFYSFLITDPDYGDMLLTLEIDWGIGDIQREGGRWCLKPWQNGTVLEYYHIWENGGLYNISARVQDVYGDWSQWSEPFPITMPKQKN